MNEGAMRWKGRLGSLKALAALVLLFAVIFLIGAISNYTLASSNPTQPQAVQIGQLAGNEIGRDRYVTFSGLALYPAAYEETEDGKTTGEFFFVVDTDTGNMILVKASQSLPIIEQEEAVTISGLTHTPETKLRDLIESDLPAIQKADLITTSGVYVGDGETPPSASGSLVTVIGLGVLSLVCVATFLFPTTVFGPRPIDSDAATAATTDRSAWATGRFKKLSSIEPSFVFGKGRRSFTNAVTNLIPLEGRQLMLYIHHVMTYRTYGIKVSERQTDWGLLIDSGSVIDIEPGKVYGWRDKWAVRFRYNDESARSQTAIVAFNQAGAQAQFMSLLRQMGFSVGSGDAPLM
ncbi:MAG: hypothetical protein HY870_20655 [Chloroflexi bacterium]|nr:hypothetical protein [Chloroflexota bacterium]